MSHVDQPLAGEPFEGNLRADVQCARQPRGGEQRVGDPHLNESRIGGD